MAFNLQKSFCLHFLSAVISFTFDSLFHLYALRLYHFPLPSPLSDPSHISPTTSQVGGLFSQVIIVTYVTIYKYVHIFLYIVMYSSNNIK